MFNTAQTHNVWNPQKKRRKNDFLQNLFFLDMFFSPINRGFVWTASLENF